MIDYSIAILITLVSASIGAWIGCSKWFDKFMRSIGDLIDD